jgi:hypothetical protein
LRPSVFKIQTFQADFKPNLINKPLIRVEPLRALAPRCEIGGSAKSGQNDQIKPPLTLIYPRMQPESLNGPAPLEVCLL